MSCESVPTLTKTSVSTSQSVLVTSSASVTTFETASLVTQTICRQTFCTITQVFTTTLTQTSTSFTPVTTTIPIEVTQFTTLYGSSCAATPPDPSSTAAATTAATYPSTTSRTSKLSDTLGPYPTNPTATVPTFTASGLPAPHSVSSVNRAAAIGGAVGGAVGLVAIGILIWFLLKKQSMKQDDINWPSFGDDHRQAGPKDNVRSGAQSPADIPAVSYAHPSGAAGQATGPFNNQVTYLGHPAPAPQEYPHHQIIQPYGTFNDPVGGAAAPGPTGFYYPAQIVPSHTFDSRPATADYREDAQAVHILPSHYPVQDHTSPSSAPAAALPSNYGAVGPSFTNNHAASSSVAVSSSIPPSVSPAPRSDEASKAHHRSPVEKAPVVHLDGGAPSHVEATTSQAHHAGGQDEHLGIAPPAYEDY